MIKVDNMMYEKCGSQVGEIICNLDIKVYFKKIWFFKHEPKRRQAY